jgi:polyhydroxyalkanoate synthase subunit PhaC
MGIFPQAQFAMIDAMRRAQGDMLDAIGFGPAGCSYRVLTSGHHWRFRSYGQSDGQRALLIVPAPIKKPYIWDLAPSNSVVRLCLEHNWSVYLLEWREPAAEVRVAGLADYADQAICQCINFVSGQSRGLKPFLIGHSLGGTLAAIFCALEQQSVRGLVLLSAPLCFAPKSSRFRDALVVLLPRQAVTDSPVPGSLLSLISAWAAPNSFVWERLADAALSVGNPEAADIQARIERWTLDEVPLPGPLVNDIIQHLYREDGFCRGTLFLRNQNLGPSDLRVPVLAAVNCTDEVVPPGSIKPFLEKVQSCETRLIEYPGGSGVGLQHLAVIVGRHARAHLWPKIFSWLEEQCRIRRGG